MKNESTNDVTMNEANAFDVLRGARKLLYIFGGPCVLSWIFILVSNIIMDIPKIARVIGGFSGIAIFGTLALPCMIVFIFKSKSLFVDLGPAFYKTESRVGNFIYERWERDYESEIAGNLLLTIFKLAIMFFLSVILTPVIAVFAIIAYKKAKKEAVKYAEEQGIEKSEIPVISKGIITLTLIVVLAFTVPVMIYNVWSGLGNTPWENAQNAKWESEFNEHIKNLPEEYFADGRSCGSEHVWAASFKTDDGRHVYGGSLGSKDPAVLADKGLGKHTEYYIIDGTLYTLIDDIFADWVKQDDEELKNMLLARHIHAVVGDAPEFSYGYINGDIDGDDVIKHCFKNGETEGYIDVGPDGTILCYRGAGDYWFEFEEDELISARARVKEILNIFGE